MIFHLTDSVELVDASKELKGLKCRPGMNRWNAMTKEQEAALEKAGITADSQKTFGLEKW